MAEENKTTPEVAETVATNQEEKKHDVEYADEEGKNAVSWLDQHSGARVLRWSGNG